jgi:hydroxyacyl-ACP dehydratase HTD2-like protein with hotdog domain
VADNQIYFEEVAIGDPITAVVESVSEVQMFFFSAATYNGHRIHYDKPYATGVEKHPDILVHGPLQVALMAKTITDWIGPKGRLVKISLQNRANAFPGDRLEFKGTVTGKRIEGGAHLVDLEVREERDGQVLMPGSTTVSLPSRS